MSTTLPLFWNLSSASKKERLDASVKLIATLEQFQSQFTPKQDSEDDADEDAVKKDPLDLFNPQDISYSIRRLIRGLASPRESSRLGFAVALTELLSRLDTVTAAQILTQLEDSTKSQGSMTGQEERDVLFARLFGITSIIQSGLLVRTKPLRFSPSADTSASSLSSFQAAITTLLELGEKKSWLRESAWWSIGLAIDALAAEEVPWKDDAFDLLVEGVFGPNNALWSPEKIAITLKLQTALPQRNWKQLLCPPFKNPDLLSSTNLLTVAKILKESSSESDEHSGSYKSAAGSWKPQLHFVWDIILDQLLPEPEASVVTKGSFPEFFKVVVDDSLFSSTSSQERKYSGFQVFQKALSRVTPDTVGMLFTKNFMRSWINHLSHSDRYLHKVAKQVAADIQNLVRSQPRLGFCFILELTGTVESILASMDANGIKTTSLIYSNRADVPAINLRRAWIVDQLSTLVRSVVVPTDDDSIMLVLNWLAVHGLFLVKKKSEKSVYHALHKMPTPPFSDSLRQQCRDRLLACLADLNSRIKAVKVGGSVPDEDHTVKYAGITSGGDFWITKVLQSIDQLKEDAKHVVLLSEIDDDDAAIYLTVKGTLEKLDSVPAALQDAAKGVELLLSGMLLQHYVDNESELDVTMRQGMRRSLQSPILPEEKGKSNKKKKESPAEDAAQEPLEPVDIIVDTIIGFLEKSTAFLRVVGNQVFSLISGSLQASTIDLILSQLERRNPEELAHDSDDGEENSDEGDEGSSGDSEIEIDEESDDEEVDPELRRKIEEALHVNGVDANDDEESDEELMDDDQMLAVDEQLAQVFKMREGEKRGKNVDAQREATHFKNRVLDLLDTFLKKEASNPLVVRLFIPLVELSTGTSSDEGHLSDKAKGILRSRLAKSKSVPLGADLDEVKSALSELHSRARRLSSLELLTTLSQCSLYLSKVLVEASEQSSLVAVYRASLEDFITRKNSTLNQTFFSDAIRRYPEVFWALRNDIISVAKTALNGYRRLQSLQLLQTLLSRLPSFEKQQDYLPLMRSFREALAECVTEACDDKVTFTAAQMKELLKLASFAMRQTYRVGSEGEARKAWDPESWHALSQTLAHASRFKAAVGLHKLCEKLAVPPQSNGPQKRKVDAAEDTAEPPKAKKKKASV
ncbi:DNA polymerase phi-domain-containing protein [Mycena amicta]|nr:DNA polymerase phi-domain-containing protein [Mycena amicta]